MGNKDVPSTFAGGAICAISWPQNMKIQASIHLAKWSLDGGNIVFQSFDEDAKAVHVVLQGACSGCSVYPPELLIFA